MNQPDLRQRIEHALLTTRRTDYPGMANHAGHRFDARCALCTQDVDALTEALLAAMQSPVDEDVTEADIDRMMAAGTPVQIVTEPPATYGAAQSPADQAALRDRIRRVLCEHDGKGYLWGTDMLEPDEYGETADAVMAVLPEPPLSPDYEHPDCGFHWHGKDGMDIPMRDGQPVCPRCELLRVEKRLQHFERRCTELREESLRRGKNVLEHSEKNRALEREIDGVRRQLGAEILRANHAEADRAVVRAETLREAADFLRGLRRTGTAITAEEMGAELRRLAGEQHAQDEELGCVRCGHEERAHSVGGCRDCPRGQRAVHLYATPPTV